MKQLLVLQIVCLCGLLFLNAAAASDIKAQSSVFHATLAETGQKTPEISTAELRKIVRDKSALVFDTRPVREYALGHIPGAINAAPKPGTPISLYVSDVIEIGRVVKGNKAAPIVLYCNGPFCGKSKRLAAELLEAGFTNVSRYQLGIPVWRSLGGLTQIEPASIKYLIENDRTAVFIDARDAATFRKGTVPGAKNLPRALLTPGKDTGEVKAAKDDGRLPMEDHNTRIVVFGDNSGQAIAVAEALMNEAFHNVMFFGGSYDQFKAASERETHK